MTRAGEFEFAALWGPREGMKRVRECIHGAELDLATLVWTRGRNFPLGMLESRLRCPKCGSRRVRVAFNIPAPEVTVGLRDRGNERNAR